ncbi:adenosine deaminase [Candidatus Woesearchaeota archaeon]|nr:adenosine deaminase [Candidatus Woesearchaeota archaeon]
MSRVAQELCEDLASDGVSYAEIRYCPELHTQKGLRPENVVYAVGGALQLKDHGLKARQIITALRNLGPEYALRMVHLAECIKDAGVVGVDLAGDEYNYPPELFVEAFTYARDRGIPITLHAGEGRTEQLAKNVRTAVELGAQRIGHGVAAMLDETVLDLLAERKVVVEICPTSNIHTKSIDTYADHPARLFHDRGIQIVPCADNRFLSQTTTSQEYQCLAKSNGFTKQELTRIAAQSFAASFDT